MTFLDFWSTSTDLYEPEVGQKSRKVISVLRPDPPPISVHAVLKNTVFYALSGLESVLVFYARTAVLMSSAAGVLRLRM